MKFLNKINILPIIKKHFDTFYNNREVENRDLIEILIYLFIPLVISIVLVIYTLNYDFDEINSFNNSLLIFLTIFTPAMFGMLSVIYSLSSKKFTVTGYKLLKEFNVNVLFIILISIITLIISLLFSLNLFKYTEYCLLYNSILRIIIYSLSQLIILTSLIVLIRFNKLINAIIDKKIKLLND